MPLTATEYKALSSVGAALRTCSHSVPASAVLSNGLFWKSADFADFVDSTPVGFAESHAFLGISVVPAASDSPLKDVGVPLARGPGDPLQGLLF